MLRTALPADREALNGFIKSPDFKDWFLMNVVHSSVVHGMIRLPKGARPRSYDVTLRLGTAAASFRVQMRQQSAATA